MFVKQQVLHCSDLVQLINDSMAIEVSFFF